MHNQPLDLFYGRKGKIFEGEYLYLALCSGGYEFEEQEKFDGNKNFLLHITPKFIFD
mgnify:CR=1 FL=1